MIRDEGGQSLVEFAFVAPVLFLFLIGLVDVGRGLQAYSALGDSVREATREAAVHGSGATQPWGPAANDPNVTNVVRRHVVGLDSSQVVVTSSWPAGSNATGSTIAVTATYPFHPVATGVLGWSVQLNATTQMRIYR